MSRLLKRSILFLLLGLSYVLLTYYYFNGWWYSSIGTVSIIFLSYLIWRKDFLNQTGLKLGFVTIIQSLFIAILLIVIAVLLMKYIANKNGIGIFFTNWKDYYHDFFYVLNEEIVLGAMPLILMIRKWKFKPLAGSLLLAALFAIVHFVCYKWIFDDRGILQITTLITLFFIGIIRNNLIIQTGHVGFSWALHFSWMVVMFGSFHQYISNNEALSQPVRFNTYLGSIELLIISTVLVGISIFFLLRKGASRYMQYSY